MESLQVKPLTGHDLQRVVQLHRSGLGYTLNSRLGADHLSFLYRSMLQDPKSYVGIALIEDQPVGVVSGTLDMEESKASMVRSLTFRQWARLILHLLSQPSLLYEWWKGNVIGRPVYFDGELVQPILTAIVVDSGYQGKGVGKCLVHELEHFFRRSNIRYYRLDTLIENSSARKFYENLGFQQVEMRADSVVLVKKIVDD